jgi:hypothetical protein
MENLFHELLQIDDNFKKPINKSDDWANDYSANFQQSNSRVKELNWSTEYLTQTESTLYNDV